MEESSIRRYFNDDEWNELGEIEKKRYINLKRNYEILRTIGIISAKPPFMLSIKNGDKTKSSIIDDKDMNPKIPQFMIPLKNGDKNKSSTTYVKGMNSKTPRFMIPLKNAENNNSSTTYVKGRIYVKGKLVSKGEMISQWNSMIWENSSVNLTPNFKNRIATLLKDANNVLDYLDISLPIGEPEIDSSPSSESSGRYPKRNGTSKCYTEEEVCSEDDFLFCDDCGREYDGECPVHGPMLFVPDSKVKPGLGPKRAKRTCPHFLSVCHSGMKHAGLGVWTEVKIPKGVMFGPYRGTVIKDPKEAHKSGYAWQIRKHGRVHHYVNGSDSSVSNWLRFVNCADCEERQNLVAIQLKGKVYYKTYKEIKPFTELLVWYGNQYAKDLGFDLKEKIHVGEQADALESYECDVCQALFATEDCRNRHRRSHPHMSHDRMHKCSNCLYSTSAATDLRKHLLTHTKERPHKCPHCPKAFTLEGHLRTHIRIHTGEKPFECEECAKKFRYSSNLRRHERIHSDQREYVCHSCGKRFKRKKCLNDHVLTHTGQKPHKCPHCEYRATQKGDLRRHVISKHTREFPHICSYCSEGFIRPTRLKIHLSKQHSDIIV